MVLRSVDVDEDALKFKSESGCSWSYLIDCGIKWIQGQQNQNAYLKEILENNKALQEKLVKYATKTRNLEMEFEKIKLAKS